MIIRNDYKIKENDYEIKENSYEIKGNDYEIKGNDYEIKGNDYEIKENEEDSRKCVNWWKNKSTKMEVCTMFVIKQFLPFPKNLRISSIN